MTEPSSPTVFIVQLPDADDGAKVGADDYLLTHSPDDLQKLIDGAKELGDLSYDKISGRIDTVLDNGGQEAFFRDSALLHAIAKLATEQQADFAALRSKLRDAEIRIRDFDRVMKPIITASLKKQPPTLGRDEFGGMFKKNGFMCRMKLTQEGPVSIPICNFTAWIVSETVVDDGAEQQGMLEVEGQLYTGQKLPRVKVPSSQFLEMRWVVPAWGSDAIIWAGEIRCVGPAIQALTDHGKKKRATVCTHTGWRKNGSRHIYLHAGGVIGSVSSHSPVSVEVDGPLRHFNIEKLPEGAELKTSIARCLLLTKTDESDDSGVLGVLCTIFAAVFRAVIRAADFGLHLVGRTGVFKSELAALVQQFFGVLMDSRHLPGSWTSTANSLEGLAFHAKDALLVIDDFAPTAMDANRMHRDADRLFRGQGNNSGRGRMRADGTLRPNKPPRGLILSTGEDVPKGHSLRARSLILEIQPGMILSDWLTDRQADARDGIYAGVMYAFLEWLSPRYKEVSNLWTEKVAELRTELSGDGLHARTPAIVAELILGFRCFTLFAHSVNAISTEERDGLNSRCRGALTQVAKAQAEHHTESEPTEIFLKLLSAVLASGRGHLASFDGREPKQPAACGWRQQSIRTSTGIAEIWQPQGRLVGWVDSGGVYLEPDASFAEVQKLATEQSDSIPTTKNTLWKRLSEKKLLASTYKGRLKVQKPIGGGRRWVVHLRLKDVIGVDELSDSNQLDDDEVERWGTESIF